jgi:peptidylprolyl isomerase
MSNGVQGDQRESDAMEDESVDADDVEASADEVEASADDVEASADAELTDDDVSAEEPVADETPSDAPAKKTTAKKAAPVKKAGPAKKAVPANKGGRNSEPAALTKPEKRALAKQAAAKRAAAARRRRIGGYVATFVVIVGIIVGVFVVLNWRGDKSGTPAASGSGTPTPAAEAPTTPAVPFPGVPDGADPALKTKPVVKAGTGTVSKLVVTPLIEGKGPATTNGQTLTVNYVGVKYPTGEEFDSSWKRSQTFDFQLGGQVIAGWNQGLVGVKVGSRVQLDIPGNLAYGDTDDGSGSPTGPLRFVVDVLAAK